VVNIILFYLFVSCMLFNVRHNKYAMYRMVQKNGLVATVSKKVSDILQGSAATRLRCGGNLMMTLLQIAVEPLHE